MSRQTYRRSTLVLTVLCLLSVVLFLGLTPFNTRGEPREAIVAFSMLQDGNWVLPVNNGDEIAFKPPLLHWLVALFSSLTGHISEFTARLPSALAATAMLVAVFRFFARRRGEQVAMLTALLALTTFEVHRAAMTCRVDMLLASLAVLALLSLYRWWEDGLRGVPWAALACLAGAALAKGPVGVVLPCGAAAVFYWLRGWRFWPVCWRMALVALAALFPLCLWYAAAYSEPHGGERFLRLIYEENVLRFTGQMSYASHINPWWYNVQTVLSGFLPYTLLALFGVCCWRVRKRAGGLRFPGFGTLVRRWRDRLRKQPPARLFAWTCVAVVFLFYCIPASKRSVYLLPLYPFLAYGLAEFFLWISRERPRALAAFGWVVSVMAFVLALAFVAVRAGWVTDAIFQGRHAAENAAFLHALRDVPLSPLALLLVVLPVLAALWCLRRQRRGACVFASVGVVFAVHLALSGFYLPTVLTVQSDRAIAERIAAIAPRGTVYSWRTDVLEANRLHPFTINFYLGDRVIPIDKAPALPRAGYLIAGNDDVEAFRRAYPQYAVRLVFDSGHRSCDDHKVVRFYTFSAADRP